MSVFRPRRGIQSFRGGGGVASLANVQSLALFVKASHNKQPINLQIIHLKVIVDYTTETASIQFMTMTENVSN